ncbi:11801_t:CDS:1, partial [Scutellospora calospora]
CCLKRILISEVISKIPNKLELPEEELGDELPEEPCKLVSDSLIELASDSLDTLCWSKLDL